MKYFRIFSPYSLIVEIFCGILSVPQNIVMDLNNVMLDYKTRRWLSSICASWNVHISKMLRIVSLKKYIMFTTSYHHTVFMNLGNHINFVIQLEMKWMFFMRFWRNQSIFNLRGSKVFPKPCGCDPFMVLYQVSFVTILKTPKLRIPCIYNTRLRMPITSLSFILDQQERQWY